MCLRRMVQSDSVLITITAAWLFVFVPREQYLPARTLQEAREKPSCREGALSSRAKTEPWKPGSEKSCTWGTHSKRISLSHQPCPLTYYISNHLRKSMCFLFHPFLITYLKLGCVLKIILKGNNSFMKLTYKHCGTSEKRSLNVHISVLQVITAVVNVDKYEKQ